MISMIRTSTNPAAIFAADHDEDDLALMRLLLRKAGAQVPMQAFSGGDAIVAALSELMRNSLKAVQPLLCFLEVNLPKLTGIEVLRWIRQQPALDKLPVVMLSSGGDPAPIKSAVQCGAQCYLEKYPQPNVLRDVVEDAERFALGAPAEECFRIPDNLLLVRWRRG